MNRDERLFLCPFHYQLSQRSIVGAKPFDEHGQSVCPDVPNGLLSAAEFILISPHRRCIPTLKPETQRLSLIRQQPPLPRAMKDLPRHDARQSHQHHGQRDVNPLQHGGSKQMQQ
jgi:hypothetical protein